MTLAPVFIPTLNRYEHLRKCLESLSRCTLAEQTEVYVALDYPPTNQWDRYAPGWKKNREFLHSCGDMGFKKLHVIERTENYGIWLPGHKGNAKCLIEQITKDYDRYIFTEDDNVFSPCFLEYMNKGLDMFENDDRVLSIGGYKFYYPIKYEENTFIRQDVDYSPWGVGRWTKKELPQLNYKWYKKQLTFSNLYRLYKNYGWGVITGVLDKAVKPKQMMGTIDNDVWIYMQLMGLQQIVPTQTLVENIGLDGSGVTMQNAIGLQQEWADSSKNPLSSNEHFEFVGTGYEHYEENQNIYYRGKYWMTDSQYFVKALKKLAKFLLNR